MAPPRLPPADTAPRGRCSGYKCTCQEWVPIPETLRDMWPTCEVCKHPMQNHAKLAAAMTPPAPEPDSDEGL